MKLWKHFLLFYLGGMGYSGLELLWRGRTHGSMFTLGGVCFLLLGKLGRLPMNLLSKAAAGSALVTAGELLTGLAVNRRYRVWDYRSLPLNFRGHICLLYSLLWMPVSLAGMALHRLLDRVISQKFHRVQE